MHVTFFLSPPPFFSHARQGISVGTKQLFPAGCMHACMQDAINEFFKKSCVSVCYRDSGLVHGPWKKKNEETKEMGAACMYCEEKILFLLVDVDRGRGVVILE